LRCRDPHDQKFLDLAFSAQAAVLLIEDEAPLVLAHKARAFALQIQSRREFGRRFG
jgi:predicted nucleic acid-binding protein